MGKSKLDIFRAEIEKKMEQGWSLARIQGWLWDTHQFKISTNALHKWWTKPQVTAGHSRDVAAWNMQKDVVKEQKKVLAQADMLVDDVLKKWNAVKDTLEPKSYEGMLQQVTKILELRGKLTGEITTGGNISFVIGTNDVKDRRFIEYVRQYVEKHHEKWDDFLVEFSKYEKATYPNITIKSGEVIDVVSEEVKQ